MLRWKWMVVWVMVAGHATFSYATDISNTYAKWERLRDSDTASIRFIDGATFLYEHSGWPDENIIRLRTEAAALNERPSRDAMAKFCVDFPPLSGRGMVACARAGVGDSAKQTAWIKQGWLQGDFNESEEKTILTTYRNTLTSTDHIARMERLLYENKRGAAKRLMPHIPNAKRAIYTVRMAFMANDKAAPRLLKTLTTDQQRDAGIVFERLRWRLARGDDNLSELLKIAPKDPPHAASWWPLRERIARGAIAKGHYSKALAAITHHGTLTGEDLAEALWLKGWLHLRHKHDAATAYKHFFKL